MAAPTLAVIAAALKSTLAADLGANDFSATGLVQRGRYAYPPGGLPRFLGIASPGFSSVQGPPLREYERRLVFDVMGWTSYDGYATESRTIAGELLLEEITAALDAGRVDPTNDLYGLRVYHVTAAVLDEDVEGSPPSYAACIVSVTCTYARTTGA